MSSCNRNFSSIVVDGKDRAPNRSMLRAVGFEDEDFDVHTFKKDLNWKGLPDESWKQMQAAQPELLLDLIKEPSIPLEWLWKLIPAQMKVTTESKPNVTIEIKTEKKYRILEVSYENFGQDLLNQKEEIKFSDLELIFKDLKSLFEKKGFIINWKALEKQSLDETINALAMASPFTLEEKQILLEAENLDLRKNKIAEILKTYTFDIYENDTIQ